MASRFEQLSREELVQEAMRLQQALDKEKKVTAAYCEELKRQREQNLAVQSQVEQEEEYITNKLMKRLEQLKKEKQALATEVEQEEEFLTNTLQKKLEKLNKEKVDLESRLEIEQEYVVNKLMKQLDQLSAEKAKLHTEKVDLENQLEAEQEYIMNKLQKQLEKLASEKTTLQRERADLQRQCSEMTVAVDKLNKEKVLLESQMEMEEENIVNRLQRQLEQLTSSYKALEGKLEAKGLTLRDMGLQPNELPPENWSSYSRSTSRASSGELSRHSWGSMRMPSLGHGPVAIGAMGPTGSIPSPTASGGSSSFTRSPGEFMGSAKHRSHTEVRPPPQQQQQQRSVSGSSPAGPARAVPGSPGQIPVAAAPTAAPTPAT